jgi:hypothetical protein
MQVRIGAVIILVSLLFVALNTREARAESYCAEYDDGTEECGIPSLKRCQQSISGVGGYCQLDQSSPSEDRSSRRLFPLLRPSEQPSNPNPIPPPPFDR